MNKNWIEITGKLIFDPPHLTKKQYDQSSWKKTAVVVFDDDLDGLYRWMIYKRYNIQLVKPQRGSHLTIINDRINNEKLWESRKRMFNNTPVKVYYDVDFRANHEYWWLKAKSEEGDNIRKLMNLGDPYFSYHITVGRVKDTPADIEFNNYIIRNILNYNIP